MTKKPFPFSVCEQCCGSGDVPPEQIEEAVEKYLEENPVEFTESDPTVPYWAKQPNKPTYTAEEVNAAHRMDLGNVKELEIGNDAVDGINLLYRDKADKAITLSGYGILDAYTQDEVNALIAEAIGEALEGDY